MFLKCRNKKCDRWDWYRKYPYGENYLAFDQSSQLLPWSWGTCTAL